MVNNDIMYAYVNLDTMYPMTFLINKMDELSYKLSGKEIIVKVVCWYKGRNEAAYIYIQTLGTILHF